MGKVNEPVNNFVQMTHFKYKKLSPFRKWGYVQGMHVTIIPCVEAISVLGLVETTVQSAMSDCLS